MLQFQRPMMNSFNRLYYAASRMTYRTGRSSNSELFLRFSFEASFTVPPAHLVCGPRGYTVQVTFPRSSAREAIVELLEICQSSPCPPVTTIIRAHKHDDHLVSFSEDGYSFNFEFHPKKRHEAASRAAVDRLIDATARRGGKVRTRNHGRQAKKVARRVGYGGVKRDGADLYRPRRVPVDSWYDTPHHLGFDLDLRRA